MLLNYPPYAHWPCDVLPHFLVLVNSLTRCAPAFFSLIHIAHAILQCSRISKFESIRPCDYAPTFFAVLGLIHV